MKKIIIILVLTLIINRVNCQQDEKSNKYWFDLGCGAFAWNRGYGISILGLDYNYALKKNIFNCKVEYHENLSDILKDPYRIQYFYNIGILYGRRLSERRRFLSFSSGISFLGGQLIGNFIKNESTWFSGYIDFEDYKKFYTLNIPIEAQYNVQITSHFGWGMIAFINLNNKLILGGLLFNLKWGKFE